MRAALQISQYLRPLTFGGPHPIAETKLTERRELEAEARAGLRAQAELFERLLADATASGASSDDLVEIAASIRARELQDDARLRPTIKGLQTKLTKEAGQPDCEARQLLCDFLDVLLGWFSLHRKISEDLLKLAAERRASCGGILMARPVAGGIDHSALSREFMGRFPKIRAALAK